jgi:PAS domain-containing protein
VAQQPVELILIRQWASYLAMPIFLADADGNLVYYNEPAEALLGRRFDEAGEMPAGELATIFQTAAEDGSPLPSEAIPLGIALLQRRPSHRRLRFKGLDGVWRLIETTAFPIEGQGGRHLGAVAIFWEAAP